MNDEPNDDSLTTLVEQLQAELNALRSSTSWKVTAPLRFFGRLAIAGKAILRQMIASPRIYFKRCFFEGLFLLVPLMKRSALIRKCANRLRQQYPNALSAFSQGAHPQPTAHNVHPSAPTIVLNSDIAYAWSSNITPADHFKNMLTEELKRRQIKINGQ